MVFHQPKDLRRRLLELILFRAFVLLLGLNVADRLQLLPAQLGGFPFLAFFNYLTLALTAGCLLIWWVHRHGIFQLYLQVGADLILTTALVAYTRALESPFVSFYVLIIIYCSLTLGHNGGRVGAALSTILYAGILIADRLGFISFYGTELSSQQATFRIAAHALGFWAVAYLGTYLHQRLQAMEHQLREKIDSLTELQRLNDHIVRSIRSGLITTDLEGRIAVFNAAAGELTARDPKEMIGQPLQRLLGEDLWGRILDAELCRNAKAMRHEQWHDIEGGRRYLGFSVSPLLDKDERLLGYILSFQDLTEIRRLEEEVRLKDRMAAVGRMAAGIAHEIRNPLTAMQGSVEILRDHASLPKTDERLLEILLRESDRLNKFVGNFLNFARPGKYARQSLDLVPVLKDSVLLLKNSPEMRDKYSVVLRSEAHSIRILGNADQLNQVFWNLAQNAIRAMPQGGELEISIRRTPEGGGQILFRDSGIGMNREEINQIFQPFHSGFSGGLGLGMTVVFQIMEDHQGKISCESQPGKGTAISLSFPPETQAAASGETEFVYAEAEK